MDHAKDDRSWFKEHMSAVFLFVLILCGFGFLVFGLLFQGATETGTESVTTEHSLRMFLGKLSVELSIAALAGAIATVFLSLRDVRHHLASTIATLFSEGKISGLLSAGARQELAKELALLRTKAKSIEESLFDDLYTLNDAYLESVHIHNFNYTETITVHTKSPNLLVKEIVKTFTLKARHLPDGAKFQYKFEHQVGRNALPMKLADLLLDFRASTQTARGTGTQYTSANVKPILSGSGPDCIGFLFSEEISVPDEVSVRFQYKIVATKDDPVSMIYVRYPTNVFRAQLRYDDKHDYDWGWFKASLPGYEKFPGEKDIIAEDAGIIAEAARGWLLPGEGVVLAWLPKSATAGGALPSTGSGPGFGRKVPPIVHTGHDLR